MMIVMMIVNCMWDMLSLNIGVFVCVNFGGISLCYLSNGMN